MKNKESKQRRYTKEELAEGLQALKTVTPDLSRVTVEVPYEGIAFTVAKATLILPKSERILVGEGISKRACFDLENGYTGFNLAVERALEAVDKKLRRKSGFIGCRFEG